MNAYQLAFELEHRPALEEEDFLVAPCNEEAVGWIDRFPDWPAPALVIHGPPACGKTHLARVFMAKTDAREIPLGSISPDFQLGSDIRALVIEAGNGLAGNTQTEEGLFHLFNQTKENNAKLLVTASAPSARWQIALPDLSSRLATAPSVEIGMPDDPLLMAVLAKMFADRQVQIDADVLQYVVPRIERSFEAARQFVKDADTRALEKKRRITVPLAREVLNNNGAA